MCGLIVNFAFCLWAVIERGILSYKNLNNDKDEKSVAQTVMGLYFIVDFLLVISAVFLADALRRLNKHLSENKHF